MALTTTGITRTIIYPSPNPAGKQFNEFVGAARMADGSMVIGFVEAFPTSTSQTGRDWSATRPQVHYMRSTDGGKMWADYAIRKLGPVKNLPAFTPQPLIAFSDGSLGGRDNGEDEVDDPAWTGPATATFVVVTPQRGQNPNVRQVNTFGADPTKETVQIARMLPNRTIGGFRATGQRWPVPGGTRVGVAGTDPYLVISKDGSSFTNGLFFAPGQKAMTFFNEWSSAELPNGDLFVVTRCGTGWQRENPTSANRSKELSSIYAGATWPVRADGSGWDYREPTKMVFSTTTAPIHPEVGVDNQTGALMFFSRGPEGIQYSYDKGVTWAPVPGVAATNYYPRALQDPDGTWHVFSHVGADDDINETDQQIVHQTFKLVDPAKTPPTWVTLPASNKPPEASVIVAAPLFSPVQGTYTTPTLVSVSLPPGAPAGSKIVYTSGTLSTSTTPTPAATSPVWVDQTVSSTTYFKWAVLSPDGSVGSYSTAKYTINVTDAPPVDPMQAKLDAANAQIVALQAQLDAANAQLAAAQIPAEELEQTKAELAQVQTHLEVTEAQVDALQDALNAAHTVLHPLATPGT